MSKPRPRSLFEFKVWIEQEAESNVFAAHCLETGAVATADDFDATISLIEEVLESEAALALEANDFTNLYSSPAPSKFWFKWNEMAAKQEPTVRVFDIKPRNGPSPNIPKKPAVSSRIEVARPVRKHA